MKKILILLMILSTLIIGCVDQEPPEKPECIADADCVPATCCHAAECIPKTKAPNCEGVFCSMECRPYTMDCGQGYCACENNKCLAKFV